MIKSTYKERLCPASLTLESDVKSSSAQVVKCLSRCTMQGPNGHDDMFRQVALSRRGLNFGRVLQHEGPSMSSSMPLLRLTVNILRL
jgi:hypothetical protein